MSQTVFSPAFWEKLDSRRRRVEVAAVDREARELAVAAVFARFGESVIWLVGENEPLEERSEKLGQWLKLLGRDDAPVHSHLLPFEDPYINTAADARRIAAKQQLQADLAAGRKMIVLSTLAALSIRLERPGAAETGMLELRAEDLWERGELIEKLTGLGYQARDAVEIGGDLAWRGNVLDVFPVAAAQPVRLEFEGRRLASLRSFDLETQRSTGTVAVARIGENRYFHVGAAPGPAAVHDPERYAFLSDLLPGCRVLASNWKRIEDEQRKLLDNFRRIREAVPHGRDEAPAVEDIFAFPHQGLRLADLVDFAADPGAAFEVRFLPRAITDLDGADVDELRRKNGQGWRLLAYAADARLLENLRVALPQLECHFFNIPCSFENPLLRLVCLTGRNYRPAPREARARQVPPEEQLRDMAEGDWVVHRRHGIGRFAGIKRLRLEDTSSEFLKIEYLDREFLYVPLHELEVLKRYSGTEGAVPALDRLGGRTWQAKTERARKAIVTYTRELLDLYAMRKAVRKTALAPVPELEEKLQQDFLFVETEDQKQAIRQVLADMEADHPMDRLICGDVSFGKTEVALRAALRAMANGRQVAFLCPTTILALQHFRNFERRLAAYPLRLAMLSRLVSGAERKRVQAGLRDGSVDLVVGTHSLLARGVEFRRLGLFIVDEEQRFGVFQKEKLKQGRETIDVLTLSATPIPRTLSMALSGLQDISLVQTPPLGRLAIKNFVGLFSRQAVVSAVLNEVERDGAVFVVYNNIERIFHFRDQLASWLPDVPIVVVHAQMPVAVIEKNLMDFIAGKFRVLLSTTIIENGIDIPRVNTMIVLNADRLGLTQMYQLRGRIGRSTRQAYAWFLVDDRKGAVSELARKRLDAIREFSELGSGYKLAEFDLALRGAGALLGNRQHGHVEALGYDYFLELLRQTIRGFKGEAGEERELALHVHFPYAISEEYIAATPERIAAYRRVLEARLSEELESLRGELQDRYGQPPAGMEKIFYVGAVKLFARQYGWVKADVHPDRVLVDAGREIEPPAGAAQLPGVQVFAGGNLELEFHGLAAFLALGKRLKRLFS
ncbi:MAG: DEAD/DEAH box helicase [Acidobacteria bacterium]|jgi:transcription-repair coupling factor (superfamily II helicase)|nr:DEAD/DEAH box helicase [Acidobacteriota bacterium]